MGFNGIRLVIWDDDPKIMLGESDGLTLGVCSSGKMSGMVAEMVTPFGIR